MNIFAILNHMGVFFKEEPVRQLHAALEKAGYDVVYPVDDKDLIKLIEMNPRICGVLFDWDKYSLELCERISDVNEKLPVHAFANEQSTLDISLTDLRLNVSFFEYALGMADDIAIKINQATQEYKDAIMPPFTKALFKYVEEGKYTFCTPGHMGGTAFQKSPAGSIFYDFYGPNTFKADVSISMPELGSLLDHSGPHKEAEEYIARTFNADSSYIVTNGTSTSNKIVGMYSAPAGSTVLVDRNCHKSLTHLMMMTDVTPIYFRPTRNAYGILGGIPQREFSREVIAEKVANTPGASAPSYAVITNSTYDGLLYNTQFIKESFNEAFMMHTSTSPQYGIVASTETAAAMMRGNTGRKLMQDSIDRAVRFRKEIKRLKGESDSWFFDVWQPENIDTTECWKLDPNDNWHGFKGIDDNHMYLDPIKITLLTPGMNQQGELEASGIPASLVAKFLDERGIVVEKTGPYNLLFLFSIGIDKSKAMQLLRALTEFKRGYDLNLTIRSILPALYKESPSFYEGMRIQELAQGIHHLINKYSLPELMYKAFDVLPEMKLTPHAAWQQELRGQTEEILLNEMVGRVSANMILPYPPGVPLVLPGEMVTEHSRPVLEFLEMLCEIGAHYPGFDTDIHGLYRQKDGSYTVKVLKV
ncbi:lysine decarboxylase LdcC [Vibrio metschnikovii]|nr:lysine decarboxylase LdcC [Vibrio metschnikovii]